MIIRHRNQAIIGGAVFLLVVLGSIAAVTLTRAKEGEPFDVNDLTPLFILWGTFIGGMASLLWTSYHLAKGKGHSTALVAFGLFPCLLPVVLTVLLVLPDKNVRSDSRRPHKSSPPIESAVARLVRYRRKALVGNIFGGFLVLVGIATIYFPVGLFNDFEDEALLGFLIFVCGYVSVLWGCRWWLKVKGWPDALIFIGLLPLTICLMPFVRDIFFIEPDLLPLSMLLMTSILLVVTFTLPNRSARATRHRKQPLRWPAPGPLPNGSAPVGPPRDDARILPVTEAHLPALAELAGVIWRQHYPGIISPAQIDYMLSKMYSLETLRSELHEQGIQFVRLLVDGRFVGFASYGPQPEPGVMKLHKCYLLPEMHGHGYGSSLLKHCEGEVRQRGARRLMLAVNKQNTKAIAAYQRNGFTVAESVITDFGNGFVMDDYLMAKDLNPPPAS